MLGIFAQHGSKRYNPDMARNPPIAVRNGQVPNQIAVDFSACGTRDNTQEKQGAGTVRPLSKGKIWAVRGSVALDEKEETRKIELEMLRILEEDEAERARFVVVDRASVKERNILTLEEIDALLSYGNDEMGDDRPGADILTQEEIDALLSAADSADSDHASGDADFLAAMEKALEEQNQQRDDSDVT